MSDTADCAVDVRVRDLVGVGFGPANLALSIAVEEHNALAPEAEAISATFLERQPRFAWHSGMLLDDASMQVSFLKDLVTQRNPASDFSFVSYLHDNDRLADFINLRTLFPLRLEFHDYLEWAAARMNDVVRYGTEVVAIEPVVGDPAGDPDGLVELFRVRSRSADGRERVDLARNVVVATGLTPHLPEYVRGGTRMWHNSELLHRADRLDPGATGRFVVVGAGQSAAEVVGYLHERFRDAEVCSVFRRFGYSPADDSPFVNRIFDPQAMDTYFHAPDETKRQLLAYHRNTNYSVVDLEDITDLYRRMYIEQLQGEPRLRMFPVSQIESVQEHDDRVSVTVLSQATGERTELDAEAVVYATGYRPPSLTALLGDAAQLCVLDPVGHPVVERDHRLRTTGLAPATAVYVQGNAEASHGLGSTLLSNVAPRAGEIVESLVGRRARAPQRVLATTVRSS